MDLHESRTGLGDMTSTLPFPFQLRPPQAGDRAGAYAVCLKTGNFGQDGEPFYRDDPEALGRVFVGPYLDYEPELARILEDDQGICGYVLAAMDSHAFYARYEAEWRPELCRAYPAPTGDPGGWNRVQQIHHVYHHPDYFCPEPYDQYPSHVHIDLLPRAQGRGLGRAMMAEVLGLLRQRGSPGAHLGVSLPNIPAQGFYRKLGFQPLIQVGEGMEGCLYLGHRLNDLMAASSEK
jgi:ribosomal protein S18 acetylase RimI-like enzyme